MVSLRQLALALIFVGLFSLGLLALYDHDGADTKLALAGLSACFAVYSAWHLHWQEPVPQFIAAVVSDVPLEPKRMLIAHNAGATMTCIRISSIRAKSGDKNHYEWDTQTQVLNARAYLRIPVTLIQGNPNLSEYLSIEYVYYRGHKLVRRKAKVLWEGTSHDSGANKITH